MVTQDAIDLVRGVLFQVLAIAGPVLLVAFLVGLFLGVLQTAMQIQDSMVAMVPRLVVIGLALILLLPWMTDRLVEYSRDLILNIPRVVSGKGAP
jgi:flagellar biosynthetic protein FliQ